MQQLPLRFVGHLVEMWAMRHVLPGKKGTQMIPDFKQNPFMMKQNSCPSSVANLRLGKLVSYSKKAGVICPQCFPCTPTHKTCNTTITICCLSEGLTDTVVTNTNVTISLLSRWFRGSTSKSCCFADCSVHLSHSCFQLQRCFRSAIHLGVFPLTEASITLLWISTRLQWV